MILSLDLDDAILLEEALLAKAEALLRTPYTDDQAEKVVATKLGACKALRDRVATVTGRLTRADSENRQHAQERPPAAE